ncbi:hypothetical protein SK128_000325, partial [Halocaridina rubra]
MANYPEQVFQNHMVHHPLLQYQMLFPSLLMSLGAPPLGNDDEDLMFSAEGNVNSIDYLRFSALANQLAITQINQVLMDIVKEPGGDNLNALMEFQKSFLEIVNTGFSQMERRMAENKINIKTNNEIMLKQDAIMTSVQDMVAKGFLDSLSKMVEIHGSVKRQTSESLSNAKEVKGILSNIAGNIDQLNIVYRDLANSSVAWSSSEVKPAEDALDSTSQSTEESNAAKEALLQIQNHLQNLTNALENFITASLEAAEKGKESLETMKEYCTKAISQPPVIDLCNITQKVEDTLDNNLKEIQPQFQNLTQDVGKFDATLVEAREDLRGLHEALAANMTKSEGDLQNLRKLTESGFSDLLARIENLTTVAATSSPTTPASICPEEFFLAGEECFYLPIDDHLDHSSAVEACRQLDAHLADPDDVLDFIIVLKDLNFNASSGVWLGGEEKEPPKQDSESTSYHNTEWHWVPSKKKIDHGWNAGFPRKIADSCLFFIARGLENGDCFDQRDYV